MRKIYTLFILILLGTSSAVLAQPANDLCSGAEALNLGGCNSGTTTGASDNWLNSIGCQGGGQHDDVHYSFTATNNQLNFTVTSTGMGNDVEVIVLGSPCGDCNCTFFVAGSSCGSSPLTDSINGLNPGDTYYVVVSSSGSNGSFDLCATETQAVGQPGQDCPDASPICDMSSFSIGTVADGSGAIFGGGSNEDVAALTCFGTAERQSQWYIFTASQSGTIEFNINPNVSSDDYDWALFDITTSGCALGSATVVECDWSGCKGSTGMSSSPGTEPGVVTSGSGCFGGPAAWEPPATITECRTYALLIDNFTTSNNGFTFTWGGVTGGMTGAVGATADFTATALNCTDISVTNNVIASCMTYNWQWGDGTTFSGPNPGTHTYGATGTYTITLEVTDPNTGCTVTTSEIVNVCALDAGSLALSGTPANDHVALSWEVDPAMNPTRFELERSTDGLNFDRIETIAVDFGDKRSAYATADYLPAKGKNYYRLILVSEDGTQHLSNLVEVAFEGVYHNLKLYPNPAGGDDAFVHFEANASGYGELTILDMAGRLVSERSVSWAAGANDMRIPTAELAPGVYHVRLSGDGVQAAGRLIRK